MDKVMSILSMSYAIFISEMNAKLDDWDKGDASWISRATLGI